MKRLLAGLLCAVTSSALIYAQAPLSPEVERHIEVVDPSRHLGEEYPSIELVRFVVFNDETERAFSAAVG